MSHRLCAALVMVSFALEGTGCAWMKQGPTGEQVSMPLQTGSHLQRRVMVSKKSNAASSASKKKKKEDSKKKAKKEATKHSTSKPTPAPVKSKSKPKPKPTHEPHPDETIPNAPERLR